MLDELYVEGQDDQWLTFFVCRTPVDKCAALYKSFKGFRIKCPEFGRVVDVQRYKAVAVTVVTHAVVPSGHIPPVVTWKLKGIREEVVKPLPIFEDISIYPEFFHRSLTVVQRVLDVKKVL